MLQSEHVTVMEAETVENAVLTDIAKPQILTVEDRIERMSVVDWVMAPGDGGD